MKRGPNRVRTEEELFERLREHTAIIALNSHIFDQGNRVAALSIAVALRTMFHKSRYGEALLRQLGLIDGRWLDSAAPRSRPLESLDVCCLVGQFMGSGIAGNRPHLGPYFWPVGQVPFEQWWLDPVGFSSAHGLLTREDIVLGLANQDAGHIDSTVELKAQALRDGTFLCGKWTVGEESGSFPHVAHAAVRTIAHEVICSLSRREKRSIGDRYQYVDGYGRIGGVLAYGETSIPSGADAGPAWAARSST